ncbi:hypothetical protein [Natrinema salaciae]|uniref:hypothetical protein n=1 Tax=Natrinema salaciae TaxID=1186196 RepID=UPI000AB99489|nr:hypothetical protein [Natrinema salaciae]
MATETQTITSVGTVTSADWAAGAIGGFVGSVLFGLIMQYVIPAPMLEMAIPAMYGIEGPALLAGWAIHQFHGVVLGWPTSRSFKSVRFAHLRNASVRRSGWGSATAS